ncbi:4239_t:CDS:2, partial [Racocetra fulgida]
MGSKHSNKDHETRNKAQQLQYRILCDKENLELIVDVVKSSSKQSCYVNEEVLSTYCALLDKEYETVDLDFHYINMMFFRMLSHCESSIFMKLSFMELLHRVLEHFKELTDTFNLNLNDSQIKFRDFAYKIVKDFAIRMEKHPLTYIE